MPRALIVYHERLGDITRCLPLARWLSAAEGYEVFLECKPQYHAIFSLVSYATPLHPGADRSQFSRVLDLQIWPERFIAFEKTGLNWMDYVYQDFGDCPRKIVFDLPLPMQRVPNWVSSAALVFPNGYSQRDAPDPRWVVLKAHQLFPGVPVCVIGARDLGCHELPTIPDLVAWIAAAKHVLTVNTSPSILASAVRDSWHHVPDLDPRHDWQHPHRIVVAR